jgi:hypothetical protein
MLFFFGSLQHHVQPARVKNTRLLNLGNNAYINKNGYVLKQFPFPNLGTNGFFQKTIKPGTTIGLSTDLLRIHNITL